MPIGILFLIHYWTHLNEKRTFSKLAILLEPK